MKKKYLQNYFHHRSFIKKNINSLEILELEVDCLTKLSRLPKRLSRHFPRVLSTHHTDENSFLELSNNGISLHDLSLLGYSPTIKNWKEQIAEIADGLQASEIMHLDFNSNGQNLCLDNFGTISLIDFNVVYDRTQTEQAFFSKFPHLKKFYTMWKESDLEYKDWSIRELTNTILTKCQTLG